MDMGTRGFLDGTSGKEPACQCRRCRDTDLIYGSWKIPWRRAWQSTPVFLFGESHGQKPGGLQSIRLHRVRLNLARIGYDEYVRQLTRWRKK